MPDISWTVADVIWEYEKQRNDAELLTNGLKTFLDQQLASWSIPFHLVQCRVKDSESLRNKLHRIAMKSPLVKPAIVDFCGLRVIVNETRDVEKVCDFIKADFRVREEASRDKVSTHKPSEFEYRSTHYIVGPEGHYDRFPEWERLGGQLVEIQVRTLLEHAWAEISHAMHYKHEDQVPRPIARSLFCVSALLELADSELTRVLRDQKAHEQELREALDRGDLRVDANTWTLQRYDSFERIDNIARVAKSVGFEVLSESPEWMFPDVRWACDHLSITRLDELDKVLGSTDLIQMEYFAAIFAAIGGSWVVSRSFLILLLLFLVRPEAFLVDDLVKSGWRADMADTILSTALATRARAQQG